MTTVNVHEAKTHLSQLLDRAAQGETITIAKAGKPVARLVPLEVVPAAQRRLGFLAGRFKVPDDFDRMGEEQIAAAFRGEQ
jgi:prevent-host-death family protein